MTRLSRLTCCAISCVGPGAGSPHRCRGTGGYPARPPRMRSPAGRTPGSPGRRPAPLAGAGRPHRRLPGRPEGGPCRRASRSRHAQDAGPMGRTARRPALSAETVRCVDWSPGGGGLRSRYIGPFNIKTGYGAGASPTPSGRRRCRPGVSGMADNLLTVPGLYPGGRAPDRRATVMTRVRGLGRWYRTCGEGCFWLRLAHGEVPGHRHAGRFRVPKACRGRHCSARMAQRTPNAQVTGTLERHPSQSPARHRGHRNTVLMPSPASCHKLSQSLA
jgi:hypothetical protein